jgi:hypothetical protein
MAGCTGTWPTLMTMADRPRDGRLDDGYIENVTLFACMADSPS